MELYHAPTSPFARKVRVAAHELGLSDRLTLVRVDPWTDQRLRAINPLSKVPTLVLEDGTVLFESAVICDYLDALGGRRLHPADGAERWRTLLLQGLADGAMTAMGRLFADERKSAGQPGDAMQARFHAARDASLDRLEGTALRSDPLIGEIAVAALLGYLDFRWRDRDWRSGRPALARWFERFEARPSMTRTRHEAPETGGGAA
jgi:glutathione S-transferase